jgi:hypothetical protein
MTICNVGARRKILFLTSKVMVSRFRCSVSIKVHAFVRFSESRSILSSSNIQLQHHHHGVLVVQLLSTYFSPNHSVVYLFNTYI